MNFTIYFSDDPDASGGAFFLLRREERAWASPLFSDVATAQREIDRLILRLRAAATDTVTRVEYRAAGYVLAPFGEAVLAVSSTPAFATGEAARQELAELRQAAQNDTFPVLVRQLIPDPESPAREPEPTWPQRYDEEAAWRTVDTFSRTVDAAPEKPVKEPAAPAAAPQPAAAIPTPEPDVAASHDALFPLLDPYEPEDIHLFHGRERETEAIYQKTFDHRFLLIYGPARVGKTSLVRCGLANRVRPTRWQPIYIRRRAHIYESLVAAIQEKVRSFGIPAAELSQDPFELLPQLYELSAKPTYLIFDQFEELFIQDATPEEHAQLFDFLECLLSDKRFPCQVILIMREAQLARLGDFQEELPSLLEHRYHLQAPTKPVAVSAVNNMLGTLHTQGKIQVQELGAVADKIATQLANGQNMVYWHCLQIYLHELHQRAGNRAEDDALPLFDPELIDQSPPAKKMIDGYLNARIEKIKKRTRWKWISTDPVAAQQLMELSAGQVECSCSQPASGSTWWVLPIFADLENDLIRLWSLLWFMLAALSFILIFILWPQPKPPTPPVCPTVAEATTCEAWMDYLCANGTDDECARQAIDSLEAYGCAIWYDYQYAMQFDSCAPLECFYEEYRPVNRCVREVALSLVDRGCPVVRDTVERIVDRIVERTNTEYKGFIIPTKREECKMIGDILFKKIGPLWVMTEDLDNTTYTWEEALRACPSRNEGWRLPCISEMVDLLRDPRLFDGENDKERLEDAFDKLVGDVMKQDECYLILTDHLMNSQVPHQYWTSTERDDINAYSLLFDRSGIISPEFETKNERIRCRCVFVDPNVAGYEGMTDCVTKILPR